VKHNGSQGHCSTLAAGFTIIELLAVVTIIGVMAVVSLPAMVGMTRSGRGATALSQVLSGVDQARNLAVTDGASTYLVLTTTDSNWSKDYRCRAFTIYEESFLPASETYGQFQSGKWTLLPDGVCFKPDPDTVFGATGSTFTSAYFSLTNQNLPVVAVKFNSLGAIEQPTESRNARIRLCLGTVNQQGVVTETSSVNTTGGQYNIRLIYSTGRGMRDDPKLGSTPAPANP
jgi:prepilin-type N-terminal cleavage/methylation domain-containing protein